MATDHRKLDEIRDARSELENHYIDELVAGRLDRRQFMRRGAVIGMSTGLMGAILAACGGANKVGTSAASSSAAPAGGASTSSSAAPATKGGTLKLAQQTPTTAMNPLTRQRRRWAQHARPDGRVPDLRQQPAAPAAADACHQVDAEQRRQDLDVHAAAQREVPRRLAADGRRRRLHVPGAGQPQERLQRPVDVRRRAQARRRGQGGLRDRRLPPGGRQRQLPLPRLQRQLQLDHRPQGHRLRQVEQDVHRDGTVQAQELHDQRRRQLRRPTPTTGAARRTSTRRSSRSTPPSSRRSWRCRVARST